MLLANLLMKREKKEEITINSDAFADEYGSKLIYDLKTDGQYLYFIIKPSMDLW